MPPPASHPRSLAGPSALTPELVDALFDFALTVTWDPETGARAVRDGLRGVDPTASSAPEFFHHVRTQAVMLATPAAQARADIDEELPPPDALPVAMIESISLGVLDGLDAADRAVIDLALRRGLEGTELASALGVPARLVDEIVRGATERADRLLGHYVLARIGHDTCPRLREALGPEPEPLGRLADQVDAHLGECSLCTDRRFGLTAATTTLTAIPSRSAPPELVDALDHLWDSEEMEAEESRQRRRRWALLVTIMSIVAIAGGLVAFWQIGSDDTEAVETTETTLPEFLKAGVDTVDLGAGSGTTSLTIRNSAEKATAYTVEVEVPWLAVTPAEGQIAAGGQTELALTIDRVAAPEGRLVTIIRVVSAVGVAEVNIAASVPKGPEILGVNLDPTVISPAGCERAPTAATVIASVQSGSPLSSVVVAWRGVAAGEATEGESPMVIEGTEWRTDLSGFDETGTVTFTVVATDATGKVTQSADLNLQVNECPPPPPSRRRR